MSPEKRTISKEKGLKREKEISKGRPRERGSDVKKRRRSKDGPEWWTLRCRVGEGNGGRGHERGVMTEKGWNPILPCRIFCFFATYASDFKLGYLLDHVEITHIDESDLVPEWRMRDSDCHHEGCPVFVHSWQRIRCQKQPCLRWCTSASPRRVKCKFEFGSLGFCCNPRSSRTCAACQQPLCFSGLSTE